MGCTGLCGDVHTAQRQMTTQIPIQFCVLVLGICLGLGIGLSTILTLINLPGCLGFFFSQMEEVIIKAF